MKLQSREVRCGPPPTIKGRWRQTSDTAAAPTRLIGDARY
jgi:hypothetical protein